MIRAVVFDMFETLITHYHEQGPLYFSNDMAVDANVPVEAFRATWRKTEPDRSTGKLSLEEVLTHILQEHGVYSDSLLAHMIARRVHIAEECFCHLHPEILPLLEELRKRDLAIGLISNCFSEEASVIRKSKLFPYFDAVTLSYEVGCKKPDPNIYHHCLKNLGISPAETLYIGDGGSRELEAAKDLGMTALQACWYLKENTTQPSKRNSGFPQLEKPLDVLHYFNF